MLVSKVRVTVSKRLGLVNVLIYEVRAIIDYCRNMLVCGLSAGKHQLFRDGFTILKVGRKLGVLDIKTFSKKIAMKKKS